MSLIPDASRKTLNPFIKEQICKNSTITTDGWKSYVDIKRWDMYMKFQTKRLSEGGRSFTKCIQNSFTVEAMVIGNSSKLHD